MKKQLRKSGVKVKKDQKAIEALYESIPHWIHHTVEDERYLGGIKYLPACDCSECGYTSRQEKDVCPMCGSKMEKI